MSDTHKRRSPRGYWIVGAMIGMLIAPIIRPESLSFEFAILNGAFLGGVLASIVFQLVQIRDESLVRAARRGDLAKVQTLLDRGHSINVRSRHGDTALIMAASKADGVLVRALLARGAEVDAKSDNGYTALIMAASKGDRDGVHALLEKGARVDTKTNKGNTASALASRNGHADIVQMLAGEQASVAYYVSRTGTQFGPYTAEELTRFVVEGRFVESELAWRSGIPEWLPLSLLVDQDARSPHV